MLQRLATRAMGTRFELVLVADGTHAEASLRAAGEAALFEIEETERRLSLFKKDSLLAHLNRRCAQRAVRVDPDTWTLLELCDTLWRASGGAFDPTVAPLMSARGFRDEPPAGIDEALGRVGWAAVELDPVHRSVRFGRPGVTLDLGAIGKGHGLDLAVRVLREAGIGRALLHGGTSSVIALGAPPGLDAWRVALGAGADAPVAHLADDALGVSAPHGRVVLLDGEPQGHVLDPLTGRSADALDLAAAVAPRAALADAWSTALLAAGPALAPPEGVETLCRSSAGGPWHHVASASPRIHLSAPPETVGEPV